MDTKKYILLGKVAPNEWRPLNEIYPEFQGVSFSYDEYEAANVVLCDMKNYLRTHKPAAKVPLTIRTTKVLI